MDIKEMVTAISEGLIRESGISVPFRLFLADQEDEMYKDIPCAYIHHTDSSQDINRIVVKWESVQPEYDAFRKKGMIYSSLEECITISLCHEMGHGIDPDVERKGDLVNRLNQKITSCLEGKRNVSHDEIQDDFVIYRKTLLSAEERAWENGLRFLPEEISRDIYGRTHRFCLNSYKNHLADLEAKLRLDYLRRKWN